jgi:hypothetical protein
MKIQFIEGVLEYMNGPYYRKNDGHPFDVDARVGDELIKTGYFELVPEKVEKAEKAEAKKAEKAEKNGKEK